MKSHDIDLMQHADGELERDDLLRDPGAQGKVDAVGELGELVRGHLEQHADGVPARRFDAMWREIDKAIDRDAAPVVAPAKDEPTMVGSSRGKGVWRRLSRWFEQHRGHIITGVVSAGAVAALALVLRGPSQSGTSNPGTNVIPAQAAKYRPTEIESLDTPGGTGTVFNLKDDDGSTTVIWVTPEDTVEGI
jgi:hypothetical protein